MLANRLSVAKASPAVTMLKMIAERSAKGLDVCRLNIGQPDFPTPDHIKNAVTEAIGNHQMGYTTPDGLPELRACIRDKFKRENEIDFSLDQITLGCGAKQCIFNALMATLNPGDEVIIPAPYWMSYPDMVLMLEGSPVIVPCSADTGFKLTPELLETHINAQTSWLIINSPCNPTGEIYSHTELSELANVLRRWPRVKIMMDDIYEHIRYSDEKFSTMMNVAPDMGGRIITINGFSKAYSMTGWRMGYAAGNPELIKGMNKIASQSITCPSEISQIGAISALKGPQAF